MKRCCVAFGVMAVCAAACFAAPVFDTEDGISLPEGWQSRVTLPNGKYRLSLSGDGKRLMLDYFNGTIFTVR